MLCSCSRQLNFRRLDKQPGRSGGPTRRICNFTFHQRQEDWQPFGRSKCRNQQSNPTSKFTIFNHSVSTWHSGGNRRDFNAEYKGYLAATQRVCISFTCVSFTPTLLITLEYSLKVNIILLDAFEEFLVKRESNKLNVNICRRVRALNHVVTNSRVAAVQYYFILFL